MTNYKIKKGLIFNIQRFSLHDGPGIRTLIFFKGCPLNCKWCSNPEGQAMEKQIFFDKRKCIKCKECIKYCPVGANEFIENMILYNRDKCILSEECVKHCLSGARSVVGNWVSIPRIIEILDKDEVFFRNSSGGVTLSGGEPTYQYDFVRELLFELKKRGFNTAMETCGYVEWFKLESLLDKLDYIIFDLKHIDKNKHLEYTGVSNELILENLKNLLYNNTQIKVRLTLIPGFNSSEYDKTKIINFVRSIKNNIKIDFINYHELGKFKYDLLGRKYEYGMGG